MSRNKKLLIGIFIALAVIVAIALIWYFFIRESVKKPDEPVPQGSPSPSWQAESFPFNIGMYGAKIKALQKALGITDDGKFGNQTKTAVIAAGYPVPLSEEDYNKILNNKDISNPIGKSVYAKFDGVKIYAGANTVYKTAKKDEWVGTVKGEYSSDYWLLLGDTRVYKSNVYAK